MSKTSDPKTKVYTQVDNLDEDEEQVLEDLRDRSYLLDCLQIVFGEFFGTFLILFVTCMGCTTGMYNDGISALHICIAVGLSVMTAIHIFGHVSGAHVNPAVTIAAYIMGQTRMKQVPIYLVSQICGAIAGYSTLLLLTPKDILKSTDNRHCVTLPHNDVSVLQAMFVELIATSILVIAICAIWDKKNANKLDSAALRIGLIVVMIALAAGPYTGASLNPARSFGPALVNKNFDQHLVYWTGPILGAIFSSYFYKKCILRDNKK